MTSLRIPKRGSEGGRKVTSTLGTIVLVGGELLGVWDSQGNKLREVTKAKDPQYFHVRLPECAPNQRENRLTLKYNHKVKRYRVECSPTVYLEWTKTKVDANYRKELIRR